MTYVRNKLNNLEKLIKKKLKLDYELYSVDYFTRVPSGELLATDVYLCLTGGGLSNPNNPGPVSSGVKVDFLIKTFVDTVDRLGLYRRYYSLKSTHSPTDRTIRLEAKMVKPSDRFTNLTMLLTEDYDFLCISLDDKPMLQ